MTADRRKQAREYAARRRDAEIRERIAPLLAGAARCPWPVCGGKRCGGPLETMVGKLGRTILTCSWCDRRKAGVCRECSRPVYGSIGKALRCESHRDEAIRRSIRASEERHKDERLARSRAYYQSNDERRRVRNEQKRAWRKENPDKVREQKKRYVERHREDPTSWYNRYHAKYRSKYRLQKRELERDRLAAAPPPRKTAPKCRLCGKSTRWKPIPHGNSGRPWTVCTPCLFPCERRARQANRRRAFARARAWLESIPKKLKRPPQMAPRGPGWERTCITPGCDIVVTHRKKKCTRCRDRDARAAEEFMAPFRGRGRRVDLEVCRVSFDQRAAQTSAAEAST